MLLFTKRFTGIFILFATMATATAQVSSLFNNSRPKSMSQRWELDTLTSAGTFVITPYKPIYILPFRWSSQPNDSPYSGNPSDDYTVDEPSDFNHLEAKFQISFKVKVLQTIFGRYGDLWVAYTQKSHWQVYNQSLSRPFRETNYEPEVILNFHTNVNMFGFKNRMAGVSFNHQSNGRDMPLSRSWNRIIFHAGFERDNWQVYLRPWIRIPDDDDDNPDIVQRIGYGDATVIYTMGKSVISFTGSTNFAFNDHFSGYAEASWSYQLFGNLKGYLQITHGYGETLIDYNNRQTTVGLGVSLVEWN
ncbi:phospholipase A [Flavobacterium zepuense]|uniref:Phosphatidylcholine 1-acylhydrolase n=2 Tax=Flavobacterium zepuense TaxID=2593302 RepID=A0A552VAF0_9FLAO|nr:phospholipase A [Flavobacterium zepuense]